MSSSLPKPQMSIANPDEYKAAFDRVSDSLMEGFNQWLLFQRLLEYARQEHPVLKRSEGFWPLVLRGIESSAVLEAARQCEVANNVVNVPRLISTLLSMNGDQTLYDLPLVTRRQLYEQWGSGDELRQRIKRLRDQHLSHSGEGLFLFRLDGRIVKQHEIYDHPTRTDVDNIYGFLTQTLNLISITIWEEETHFEYLNIRDVDTIIDRLS